MGHLKNIRDKISLGDMPFKDKNMVSFGISNKVTCLYIFFGCRKLGMGLYLLHTEMAIIKLGAQGCLAMALFSPILKLSLV